MPKKPATPVKQSSPPKRNAGGRGKRRTVKK